MSYIGRRRGDSPTRRRRANAPIARPVPVEESRRSPGAVLGNSQPQLPSQPQPTSPLQPPSQQPPPSRPLQLPSQLVSQPQQQSLQEIAVLLYEFSQTQLLQAQQAIPRAQPNPQSPRYIYKQTNYINANDLQWPQHTAQRYTHYYNESTLYIRIVDPEHFIRYPRNTNPPLVWARVEGMAPRRNNLIIVVLPLRQGRCKLPAFAIPLEHCRLSQDSVEQIRIAGRDTLNIERARRELPNIDYIAHDLSTDYRWIFAWSQNLRIITTQTLWTTIWRARNRGQDAINQYYIDSGVTPSARIYQPLQAIVQAQQQPVQQQALQQQQVPQMQQQPVQQQALQVQQQQVPQQALQQQQVPQMQQQPDLRQQVITIIQSQEVITIIRHLISSVIEERSGHDASMIPPSQQVVPTLEDQQRQAYRQQLRKVELRI